MGGILNSDDAERLVNDGLPRSDTRHKANLNRLRQLREKHAALVAEYLQT